MQYIYNFVKARERQSRIFGKSARGREVERV